jgi:predicted nuclease of predicted toxin-antitoxin system
MRFLIDECLHESLLSVAHAAGFEAAHVNYLGLSGQSDWAIALRIRADEFTFVTNNRADFIRLFAKLEVHRGLIILIPNVVPALQRALFQAAIDYSAGSDLLNTVIEVNLAGDTVRLVEYQLPKGGIRNDRSSK